MQYDIEGVTLHELMSALSDLFDGQGTPNCKDSYCIICLPANQSKERRLQATINGQTIDDYFNG